MKYTTEIEINKPVEKVVELFDNAENLPQWMEGLESFEHMSGEAGQVGAKSLLKFKMGKREVELIETITVKNLPEEFSGTYETNGVINIVRNKFIALPNNRTKYFSEQEFQFKGFMKLMAILMSGAIKKRSMKHLTDFKKFVEKN